VIASLLHRNRDFVLLQTGLLLSSAGSQMNGIAYPLLVLAPLGPLAVGLLLDTVSERATIAVFATFGLVLAVWGTLSPSIRAAPSLDALAELPGVAAAR
jgi:hypothetical protein